jgi:hypothetical protein
VVNDAWNAHGVGPMRPAIGAGGGAQKSLTNYCTISCTIQTLAADSRNHQQFFDAV